MGPTLGEPSSSPPGRGPVPGASLCSERRPSLFQKWGTMNKTLAAVVTAVLALGLSSCGNNDDQQASKAISDSIMKSQSSAGNSSRLLDLKRKDADCIGDGLVDKIGTDQLQKYKILTQDLKANKDVTGVTMSAGDAKSATDVLFGCTDVPGMMQKALNSSGQIPAQMKACVSKQLNEANLRPMFEKVFNGKEQEATQGLIQAMSKCGLGSAG